MLAALYLADATFGRVPGLNVTPCLLMQVWYFLNAARCAAVSCGRWPGVPPARRPAGARLAQALNAACIFAALTVLPVPPKVTPWVFRHAW